MKTKTQMLRLAIVAFFIARTIPSHASVITYNNRATFNEAIRAPVSVEDFTSSYHFPITTGILNSLTSLVVANGGPITPGAILPGVTYSTQPGTGHFFNIDAGAWYVGGFLDSYDPGTPDRALTVTFDRPVRGFGFDANSQMGNFNVTVHLSDGPDFSVNYPVVPSLDPAFFGFISGRSDITSVTIHGDDYFCPFALDNFTFPTAPGPSIVAGPPQRGIQGQAVVYYPGSFVEVEPGVWLGHGGFALPVRTSFTVLSAHSGRQLGRFSTDPGGAFEVSLPPGKYVVVPDRLDMGFGCYVETGSFELTVKPRGFTDATIWYFLAEPCSIVLPPMP